MKVPQRIMLILMLAVLLINVWVGGDIAGQIRPVRRQLPDKRFLLTQEEELEFDRSPSRRLVQVSQQRLQRRDAERLRFRRQNPDFNTQAIVPSHTPLRITSRFSWREKGMVTPIKDQSPSGTCWAFSAVARLEAMYLIRHRETLDLSEQALIRCNCRACNGEYKNTTGIDHGQVLIDVGLPLESEDPYMGDGKLDPCDAKTVERRCSPGCRIGNPTPYRAAISMLVNTDYGDKDTAHALEPAPTAEIKQALLAHGPIHAKMHIPDGTKIYSFKGTDVFKETVPLVYDDPQTKENERNSGGHLVNIVGWDDMKQAWEIKNSWGTDWGDKGFGWIAYGSNKIGMGAQWTEPVVPDFRVTSVWRKSAAEEKQIYGWDHQQFHQLYDQLWPQGWRLHQLENAVVDGKVLYSAVWRRSSNSEVQIYNATFANYKAKYDDLFSKGWRLALLNNYEAGGTVRYTAVCHQSTEPEVQSYNTTFQDFKKKYDELYPQGWRLYILNTFTVGGQPRYTAVWRKGTYGEVQIYGASFSDYKQKYDRLWIQGWRLYTLSNYVLGGKVYFSAVFQQKTDPEVQVYSWEYTDFRAKGAELANQGWRLYLVNTYNTDG